jgi:glycosyltransferase involved in cell wall biosynthesis
VFERVRGNTDEIVILDDFSDNQETIDIIMDCFDCPNVLWFKHALDKDYGAHKNFGNEKCSGDWIFQIDGDELPTLGLLENVKTIIESNSEVELIFVPRINDFRGVTPEHAKQWGWKLTPSPSYENRLVVNWPDSQGRIYKRDTGRIRWDRKLHEKIVGHTQYSFLPAEEEWALYHDKTIETQIKTNLRYNQVFTETDNKGHTVV